MKKRPGVGTVSDKVWVIADEMVVDNLPPARKDVIAAAASSGVHEKTASTQFGHWKRKYFPTTNSRPSFVSVPVVARDEPQNKRRWDELVKHGFTYLADWTVNEDGQLVLDIPLPREAGVYVFVVDDAVVYVGVTQRTLHQRMSDYRRGHASQKTSSRVQGLLQIAVGKGSIVRVLYAIPENSEWNGWPVVTSMGLEEGLIKAFRPAWNMRGNRQT